MSLTLKFGTESLGVVTQLRVEQSDTAPETRVIWRVELVLDAATPEALEALQQAIREAQATAADLKLLDGASEVRSLPSADCRHGPTLKVIAESDTSPGEPHNRRKLTLTFEALLQDAAAAVQSNKSVMQVRHAAGAPATLVHSGKAILRSGENPADHETSVLPAQVNGYRRTLATTTRDVNEPSITYEVEDEQVFTALPGGVDDGHYIVTDSLTEQGVVVRTISGFFVGISARARAEERRPADDKLLEARVSENPFTRRVDFEFRESVAHSDAVARTESLSFTTTRRVVDHALLNPALPAYRQQIGAPQTEVIQEGSAVGDGRHPSPPPVRFAADLIERRVHYSVPHPALPADRRWVTTWRYVSRTRAATVESTP